MASSGTINGRCSGSGGSKYSFWVDWEESNVSQSGNNSRITFWLRVKRNDGVANSAWNRNKKPSVALKIDGQAVALDELDYIDTRNNATCTFGVYYTIRAHNEDGSKSLSVAASFTMYDTPTLTGGSLSGTAVLNTIPRATTPAFTSAVTMGSDATISLPRASSAFTHTLTYVFGNASGTIGTGLETSVKWDVPLSLANQVPNAASGIGTLTCKTYAGGTLIGTKSISFTASVPRNAQTIPTINMTVSPDGDLPSVFSGLYIQGKTAVSADFSGSSAKYGAAISECSLTVEGKTVSEAPYTSGILSRSGDITVTGTVKDSRGFTAAIADTISVYAYNKPVLIPYSNELGIVCTRCESDGTVNDAGTYLKIKVGRKFSKLVHNSVQKNFCLIRYRNKAASSPSYSAWKTLLVKASASDEIEAVLPNVVSSIAATYMVEIGVIDDMGEHTEIAYPIPTAYAAFHLKAGGNGAAFGKYAEKEHALEIVKEWDLWYKGIELINLIYPVGSIFMSTVNTNPSTYLGGTWVAWGAGRVPVGVDTSQTEFSAPEKTGGEKVHTLTTGEMPTHVHTPTIDGRAIGVNDGSLASWHAQAASDWNTAGILTSTTSAGSGQAHNNLQPYITCYMWKRTA